MDPIILRGKTELELSLLFTEATPHLSLRKQSYQPHWAFREAVREELGRRSQTELIRIYSALRNYSGGVSERGLFELGVCFMDHFYPY